MAVQSAVVAAASRALGQVLRFTQPADAVLSAFFRQEKRLGQQDRAMVAESVFGVLRHKRTLDTLLEGADPVPRKFVLAWLARFGGRSMRELAPALQQDDESWIGELKSRKLDDLPPAVAAELPDWLVDELGKTHAATDILALGRALQQPAPLDVRVNAVLATRDEVLAQLAANDLEGSATPYSPVGIRLKGKPALARNSLFTEGKIEVQDEGSQLLTYLVAPRRRELVVDFCAGAGGKTLALGAMMANQGRLYAFDVSRTRLERLRPRLKRSGLSNLHPHVIANEHDIKVKRLAGKIDRVLVDAPCSGLGTLRRNPDLKWRQSPESVAELTAKQTSILRSAARLVKTGGRLVYATCSLLRAENEEIVDAFLAQDPTFALLDASQLLREQNIALDTGRYLQLRPDLHGTDGFFAAVLEKR